MIRLNLLIAILLVMSICCQSPKKSENRKGSYGYDLDFLRKYDNTTLELYSSDGDARAILSARYQGRVMTSSAAGEAGTSYGWINYDLIGSGKVNQQFNPVGGEERFWLGPEGGQFSLYFAPGDSFKISNWQVPPIIDTITYAITSQTDISATFEAHAKLINYSGTTFDVAIVRSIDLLSRAQLEAELEAEIQPSVNAVAYRSTNTLTNEDQEQWTPEKGLISIWLLGMMTPSPATTAIVPFAPGSDTTLINTDYFGDIPPGRLAIVGNAVVFKCDGLYRSKIGLPSAITTNRAGSYDAERGILTIIVFQVDSNGAYVNSKWELQDEPFKGDVVNSYNDGPLADGSQLGPFYELESSSAASPLRPGESQTYSQVTCHFEGDFEALNSISKTLLFTDLNDIKNLK